MHSGQAHGKGGALPYNTVYVDFAAVSKDDGSDDREAKTAAAGSPGTGLVHTVEPFKNMANSIFRNTNTGIGDL